MYEESKVVANILSRSTSGMSGYTLLYKTLGHLHSILVHTLPVTGVHTDGKEGKHLYKLYCNNMLVETRMVVNNIM